MGISFLPDLPEETFAVVQSEMEALDGVEAARPLFPDSDVPEVRRLWVAYVSHSADAEEVAARLRSLPEVESATVQALRWLT